MHPLDGLRAQFRRGCADGYFQAMHPRQHLQDFVQVTRLRIDLIGGRQSGGNEERAVEGRFPEPVGNELNQLRSWNFLVRHRQPTFGDWIQKPQT